MLKRILVVLLCLILLVLAALMEAIEPARAQGKSQILDHYIVVLKDDVDADSVASEMVKNHGIIHEHTYKYALKGFSAVIPQQKLEKVKKDPRVQFVTQDRILAVSLTRQSFQTVPTGINRIGSQLASNKGTRVGVAVLDTGIDLTHPDLAANISQVSKSCVRSKNANDDNGHGSHVAGIIAGLDNSVGVVGVAPEATLFAVKVLNQLGMGTWSQVICGIDWITANAAKYDIKVVNMSFGGIGTSDNNCGNTNTDALHKAICNARDVGVTFVAAAGNDNANASATVPGAYDDAVITVSALVDSDGKSGALGNATPFGADDAFANFSNFGKSVDIAAPGVSILSTYKNGGYATLSGTSMAAPHVAGAAALYLKTHTGANWTEVRDGLKSIAEPVGYGHFDPSGNHPEPVVRVSGL